MEIIVGESWSSYIIPDTTDLRNLQAHLPWLLSPLIGNDSAASIERVI
jgi:hypothetical protein